MRILLIGPTAVGKTELSIRLAETIGAEIISADSRQCYEYLDIGTAKPSEEELKRVPHFNISILDPAKPDSAAAFYERAMQWEQQIKSKGKHVLYVGGSTLHLQSVLQPFDDIPSSDEENLSKLEQQVRNKGIESLYARLKEVDPHYATKMDGMNTQRILRALDVWMQTGRPFSSYHSDEQVTLPEKTLVFGLNRDREKLYRRINERADLMMEKGFMDEVKFIVEQGYTAEDPGLNTVGYKDAIVHLKGETSREQMIKDMKTQTRRYAKRQLTWFRRWDFIEWVDAGRQTTAEIVDLIRRKLAAKTNKS